MHIIHQINLVLFVNTILLLFPIHAMEKQKRRSVASAAASAARTLRGGKQQRKEKEKPRPLSSYCPTTAQPSAGPPAGPPRSGLQAIATLRRVKQGLPLPLHIQAPPVPAHHKTQEEEECARAEQQLKIAQQNVQQARERQQRATLKQQAEEAEAAAWHNKQMEEAKRLKQLAAKWKREQRIKSEQQAAAARQYAEFEDRARRESVTLPPPPTEQSTPAASSHPALPPGSPPEEEQPERDYRPLSEAQNGELMASPSTATSSMGIWEAVMCGYDRRVAELLASQPGEVCITQRDITGSTLLHAAAQSPSAKVSILEKLLGQSELDINAYNNAGLTPLLMAIRKEGSEAVEKVELLIQRGARIDIPIQGSTRTPLLIIARKESNKERVAMAASILQQAAQDNNILLSILSARDNGTTALECATAYKNQPLISLLLHYTPLGHETVVKAYQYALQFDDDPTIRALFEERSDVRTERHSDEKAPSSNSGGKEEEEEEEEPIIYGTLKDFKLVEE